MKKQMNWTEFSSAYCERQQQTPEGLSAVLYGIVDNFDPVGFMLLECQMIDSSRLGEYTILPFGGKATFQEVPDRPISPRGLASDMSTVKGWIAVNDLEPADLATIDTDYDYPEESK